MQIQNVFESKECDETLCLTAFHESGKTVHDFSNEQTTGKIKGIANVFIDNSLNNSTFTLRCDDTYQTIKCPPHKQGYFALTTGGCKFTTFSESEVPLQFLTHNIITGVW